MNEPDAYQNPAPSNSPPWRIGVYLLAIIIVSGIYLYPKYAGRNNSFSSSIPDGKIPVLLEYTSPDCGNCAYMKPLILKLAKEYENRVAFVEISINDPHLADYLKVYPANALPTFYLLDDTRKVAARFESVTDPALIKKSIEEVLSKENTPKQ